MADNAWWGPVPHCPVHGQMHYVPEMSWWACAGFDGEGCPERVTDEDRDPAVVPLGRIDIDDWDAQFGPPALTAPPGGWPFRRVGTVSIEVPLAGTPWADPGHDVAGDLRDAKRKAYEEGEGELGG